MQAILTIDAANAKRGVSQLLQHFKDIHRLTIENAGETGGNVHFKSGSCKLRAEQTKLWLELDAPSNAITELQDFIAHHLTRFGFAEEADIQWNRVIA